MIGDPRPLGHHLDIVGVDPAHTHRLRADDVPPRGQSVSLLLYHHRGVEVVTLLAGTSVSLGRGGESELVVGDPSLSREHARFTHDGEEVHVRDLGSTNGTRVNGEMVQEQVVRAGDRIELGAVVASLHVLAPFDAERAGFVSHDAFGALVGDEVVRARTFERSVAVLVARTSGRRVADWFPSVRGLLRPVDRVALYANDTLEILLPEADAHAAQGIAQACAASANVQVGVSVFPLCATTAGELISTAGEALRATSERAPVRIAPGERSPPSGVEMVAESDGMKAVLELVERVATAQIPVLILGETGVGKEVVAHALHRRSTRPRDAFRCVNCGAIPANLVESTLFGHEKGAFTGAGGRTAGIFEDASGGTVLLDEVGELPAPAQVALLRVLENGCVTRVGGTREVDVDVRIVAATHRDLESMVADGAFREDLYFRLNAFVLSIPPLRERRADLDALLGRFLVQAAKDNGRTANRFDDAALRALRSYAWPGNVRELRNVIERAVVVSREEVVGIDDLPPRIVAPRAAKQVSDAVAARDFKTEMKSHEARVLTDALHRSEWNQTHAAKLLGMPLRTLVHKLKSHGIKKP